MALIVLFNGVATGFVEGTIAQTTPTGLAILVMPFSLSSLITPMVLMPFKSRKSPMVLRLFLFSLSLTLPNPVVLTAISLRY